MSSSISRKIAAAAVITGQYDDGLTTFYNVDLGASPGHIAYNGIGRVGVRYDASASGLNTSVKSVLVKFRKYGSPTGNITVGVRKASDDSLVTIGTFPIEGFNHVPAATEQSLVLRLRSNVYQMVQNDVVSVEFPSNATNGIEISTSTTEGNPSNYTGRSHNGTTWSNTANPPAITIKG
jgi:hypothetical protein